MNRALIFGIAIFFAVVGIALLGADNSAVAGHGCNGCNGCSGYDCGGCHGGCHGGGLFHRLRNRGCHGCHGCHGYNDCCGQVNYCQPACQPACQQDCCQPVSCCGTGYDAGYQGHGYGAPPAEGGVPAPAAEAPPAPEAPAAPAAPSASRSQLRFRQVSFRR